MEVDGDDVTTVGDAAAGGSATSAPEAAAAAVAVDTPLAETAGTDSFSNGYEVGEFAYIKNDGGAKPSICLLTRLYRHEGDGMPMFEGVRYLHPDQTHHVATRMFYENEVFKTKEPVIGPIAELDGKCWVLFMREYCAYTVAGINPSDLYCCESRYTKSGKKMDKIRNFTSEGHDPELVPREEKLHPRDLPKVLALVYQHMHICPLIYHSLLLEYHHNEYRLLFVVCTVYRANYIHPGTPPTLQHL
jgi:hypothetical protein